LRNLTQSSIDLLRINVTVAICEHDQMTSVTSAEESVVPVPNFLDLLGFHIVERSEGHCVGRLMIQPEHLNRGGSVHGGVYSTLIDIVGCGAGLFSPHPGKRRQAVTLSLSVQFTGRAVGGVIIAAGAVQNSSRRVYTSAAEIRGEDGSLLAHGIGTFQYLRGSDAGAGEASSGLPPPPLEDPT
jgi:uncharacterized protein (TIGR00369 family)